MNPAISHSKIAETMGDSALRAEFAVLQQENERLRLHLQQERNQKEALERTSRRDSDLRLALDAAQLGTWDWDVTTGAFHWSERCKEIHGIPAQAAIDYDGFLALLHPDDRARVDAAAIGSVFDATMLELEYRCVQPDGTTRWIASSGRTLFGGAGRPYRATGVAFDVTSRKEIEEALRTSEAVARARAEELETLMDTAPAGVFVAHDPACHSITANQAGRDLTRTTPGDSLTVTPAEGQVPFPFEVRSEGRVIAPEDLPMPTAGRTGKVVSRALEIHFPDGLVRFLYGTAAPLRDPHGNVRGVIGTFLDITEQKLAERELARSRRLFERIAAATPDVLYVYDVVEGRCVYANKGLSEMLGYRAEDIAESGGWSLAALIHPEDFPASAQRIAELAARPDGDIVEQEYRIRHIDGRYRWMRTRSVAFSRDADGTLRQVLGLAHDATETRRAEEALKASEELYRVLTEVSPQIVWTADTRGALDFCNQNWCRFSGLTFEQSKHLGWLAAVHPEFKEPVGRAWKQSMIDGRSAEIELPLRRHDGVYRWHLGRTVSVCDTDGKLVRWIGIALDIDERKKAEDALRQHERELRAALASAESAREAAETADRVKDQFLAVLSHELRTPLTPVLMAISALQMQPALADPIREVLQMIRRNIELEASLIEDLLDVTRIARGKMEFSFSTIDLHEVITRALEICAGEIAGKSHHVVADLRAKNHVVRGDFARLQQVFWNIIKNAAKFTPASGCISIRSENIGGLIRVEITDSGIGIAPEALPRIFSPFEQGSAQVVREFGGLGLGLAIARATIDAHSGRIAARSAGENRGAIFSVELPTLP